jgi:hypothetical protein
MSQLLVFALAALLFSVVTSCNVTGTWVDRSGKIATLLVLADGSIAATSFSHTLWSSAQGRVIDDAHIWIAFHPDDNETGTLESNCSTLVLPGAAPSIWGKVGDYLFGPSSGIFITDVHMVFMAHLDLGYTDLARNICDYYFTSNLLGNAALARALANSTTPYALTSHAFLIAEFFDGASGCAHARPSPGDTALIEAAVRDGHIRWHAQSANYNAGLMDAAAFAAQVSESDRLNARFGTRWGSALMKSTDVPGLTRSVVPHLAALGRQAIHTGGNSKCMLPHVPQAFTWAHPESSTSLLALATNDYGGTLVIPPHALIINYQGDNSGAPSAVEVAGLYAAAALTFPSAASVRLSSFEEFVEAAQKSSPGASALPVISSEMGDSWAYGAGADPFKLAAFRETRRVIAEAIAGTLEGQAAPLATNDPNLLAFQRRILVGGPEHNGGVSIGGYLPSARGSGGQWDNIRFHKNIATRADYAFVQSSYEEKLNFTTQPLQPVAPVAPAWTTFLAARAARIQALTPAVPDVSSGSGFVPLANVAAPQSCGRLTLVLNSSDGSVASLVDKASTHEWVGGESFFGLTYRTYNEADFNTFNAEYTPRCGVPCENFAKVGMDSASPLSKEWRPVLLAAYARSSPSPAGCSLLLQLALPDETVSLYGGSPAVFASLDVDADGASAAPQVALSFAVFNKTLTRLAEAAWVSFTPATSLSGAAARARAAPPPSDAPPPAWWLDVLGEPVDPLDVVPFGTRHLHAVDSGFGFGGGAPRNGSAAARARAAPPAAAASVTEFSVETLDAALVAPGDRDHMLHYDGDALPALQGGMHVNLFNNLWGTTFAQWWARDILFRFRVTLAV